MNTRKIKFQRCIVGMSSAVASSWIGLNEQRNLLARRSERTLIVCHTAGKGYGIT